MEDIDKARERYLIMLADTYGLTPNYEFSNFLNAKGKKKIKVGNLKKGLQKLGGQIKGGTKAIGKGAKNLALAVPRTAFLSLLDLNYRGFGWKIQSILTNPILSKEKEQLKKNREQLCCFCLSLLFLSLLLHFLIICVFFKSFLKSCLF